METIQYKLEQFEGPLELLLSLVTKHKMDIEDIPIDVLCDQYMAYINEASRLSIELACEFLSMASELMLIKSRMLLPRTDTTVEDPRTPLVNALSEYKKAKLAASELAERFAEYGSRMVKEPDDISPDRTFVAPHHVELLRAALLHALSESGTRETSSSAADTFERIVRAPQVSVKLVIGSLLERLKTSESLYLDTYFAPTEPRSTLIAKFIGILELIKSHVIDLSEDDEVRQGDGITDMTSHVRITLIAGEDALSATLPEWE